MDDHVLLREYVEHRSERAFAELVERHLPFVYATALRLARDPHTAQDIAQAVFIQLARKANTVRDGHALPGWLYRATRYAALVVFRSETRRRRRETDAMNLVKQNVSTDSWAQFAPLLDEALDCLDRADQNAVLLRFFHEKSYREVGVALGLNEDAARKRVERALEDVRGYFSRRGVTTTAALLGSAITSHAAVLPPVALSASVAGASLAGATAAGTVSLGWKIFFMSTQTKIIATTITVAVIAAIVVTIPMFHQQQEINYLGHLTDDKETTKTAMPANQPVVAGNSALPAIPPPVALRPPVVAPVAKPATPGQLVWTSQVADPSSAQAQTKAVLNNLRQISSAAQQYMLDMRVTQATYYDLVGTRTDNYLRNVTPVGNEDYTGIVVNRSTTEISIVGPDGSTITYSQ